MTGHLEKSQFAASLHTLFDVQLAEGGVYPLELVQLQEFNHNPRIEQFSLLFHGTLHTLLPQQIYTLQHPGMGQFELFLVPLGPDARQAVYQYEAVFNRFIPEV